MQFNFRGLIESGGPEETQNLWRLGSPTASLAGGAAAVVNMRLASNGELRFGSGNTVYQTVNVGLDTPFSVNLVVNAAPVGGDAITYDRDGTMVTLLPQHFSMYINDTLYGTWEAEVQSAAGIGRVWFLTGAGAADLAPTMQIGSYEVRLGSSIAVIPEPRTYAPLSYNYDGGLIGCEEILRRLRGFTSPACLIGIWPGPAGWFERFGVRPSD